MHRTTAGSPSGFELRALEGLEQPGIQWIVVALLALTHLVTLWPADLVAWDEALYAHRVVGVVADGLWLDQTAIATGGLWTSSHPPLLIWAMALSTLSFGLQEWSLRIPGLLSSLGICLLLFRLGIGLTGDRRVSWLMLIVFLCVPYIALIARRAQLDGGALFFMTLSFYLFAFPDPTHVSTRRSVASGIALGLGLMSKLVVAALVPLSLFAYLVWQHRHETSLRSAWRGWALHAGVGAAIATPWLAYMTATHGLAYWERALGYHVLARIGSPLEGHGSPLGILYWPLQVLVFFGPVAPFIALGIWRWRPARPALRRLALCWLGVPFAVFCVTATRHDPYFLMFALPAVFFAAVGVLVYLERQLTPSQEAVFAVAIFGALCWRAIKPLRAGVEQGAARLRDLAVPEALDLLPLLGLITLLAGLLAVARSKHSRSLVTAAALVIALNGLYTVGRSFRSQSSDWHRLRGQIGETSAGPIEFLGAPSPSDRFYLRAVELDQAHLTAHSDATPRRVVSREGQLPSDWEARYELEYRQGELLLLAERDRDQ